MKKVKILKKPRKGKIDKSLLTNKDKQEDDRIKKKSTQPLNKNAQGYLNFYDDIKVPSQKHEW